MTFDLDASRPLSLVLGLVLAFGVKHLIADFFLQTTWMACGKARVAGWQRPLAAHATLHGLGTLIIALAVGPALWWLAAADVVTHATIDRLKALFSLGGHLKSDQPAFWWAFGLDQEAHALTHLIFVALLASS